MPGISYLTSVGLSTSCGPYLVHTLVRQRFNMAVKRLKEAESVEPFKDTGNFKKITRQSLHMVYLFRGTCFCP